MRALRRAYPRLELVKRIVATRGDRILDRPLPEIGGKGLFTRELEVALRDGSVHAAVHSLKDLPVEDAEGLLVAAIPARAEARDVLISLRGYTLETLPRRARVGTSSLRRTAQLLALRPDLEICPLRGNVDTRLRKALEGRYEAIVLAGAGVERLGLQAYISQWLPLEVMLPAPGQGAMAVQCRLEDGRTRRLLAILEDIPTRLAVSAERAFLAALGGGCSLPIAAHAAVEGRRIRLQGLVASPGGEALIRCRQEGDDPGQVGSACAREALAQGAARCLARPQQAYDA